MWTPQDHWTTVWLFIPAERLISVPRHDFCGNTNNDLYQCYSSPYTVEEWWTDQEVHAEVRAGSYWLTTCYSILLQEWCEIVVCIWGLFNAFGSPYRLLLRHTIFLLTKQTNFFPNKYNMFFWCFRKSTSTFQTISITSYNYLTAILKMWNILHILAIWTQLLRISLVLVI